jgi:hypothetical protein
MRRRGARIAAIEAAAASKPRRPSQPENATMPNSPDNRKGGEPAIQTPPIVSPQAWEAARQQMLVKEKAQMRAHDALAAERRRRSAAGRRWSGR